MSELDDVTVSFFEDRKNEESKKIAEEIVLLKTDDRLTPSEKNTAISEVVRRAKREGIWQKEVREESFYVRV